MQARQQYDRRQGGSAFILVVVVTVLLAVVGVMFVMVARVGEAQTGALVDTRDLDAAVDTVVARIHTVLVEDLFGADGVMLSGADDPEIPGPDEPWDYAEHTIEDLFRAWEDGIGTYTDPDTGDTADMFLPGLRDDIWLASLEPVLLEDNGTSYPTDDVYIWPQITDLWGTLQGRPDSLYYQQFIETQHALFENNPGIRWVDPPQEDIEGINWGSGANQVDWDRYGVSAYRVISKIIRPDSRTGVIADGADGGVPEHFFPYGARADASGDGVADSRWVIVPDLTTSRGRPVYAAVRIIDNCAMLNLNTAFGFAQQLNEPGEWGNKAWFISSALFGTESYDKNFSEETGRYLGELNFTPFLRAYDRGRVERLRLARDPSYLMTSPEDYFKQVILNIESPEEEFTLFGIDDELEIRNRYLLTSKTVARFEKRHLDSENRDAVFPQPYSGALYYTFDLGRGTVDYDPSGYGQSRVPRIPVADFDGLAGWKDRVNPEFFDFNPHGTLEDFKYDRRHISTFYSFDRPLRSGRYPIIDMALREEYNELVNFGLSPQEARQRAREIEQVFRPLDYRPLDMRRITHPDPFNDGQINEGLITANTSDARRNLLHLLYAFRAVFLPDDFYQLDAQEQLDARAQAARQAAQIVASLIDYLDDQEPGPFYDEGFGVQESPDPTFITEEIVNAMIAEVSDGDAVIVGNPEYAFGLDEDDIIFGYERQPFISELYTRVDDDGNVERVAVELFNPYDADIELRDWNVVFVSIHGTEVSVDIPETTIAAQGRLVLGSDPDIPGTPLVVVNLVTSFDTADTIYIMRRISVDPELFSLSEVFMPVDCVERSQIVEMTTDEKDGNPTYHSSKRDDNAWKVLDNSRYVYSSDTNDSLHTLGQPNGVSIDESNNYQLPVPNVVEPFYTLGDFTKVLFTSNKISVAPDEPGVTITQQIADAAGESEIRYDVEADPQLLDYICFLNRPDVGSLPGRININTAALHVIAAAIPPQLVMGTDDDRSALDFAKAIVDNRPYERVSDLLTIEDDGGQMLFQQFADDDNVNVGDPSIQGDIEERDWILSRLANIFTVRSDTFTAYILVRLGENGPQRRMIGIFDRSQVWSPNDRPKLVALHPVPDPR